MSNQSHFIAKNLKTCNRHIARSISKTAVTTFTRVITHTNQNLNNTN